MLILRDVLDELDLPEAELSAARLDGEVYGLGTSFAPIDVRSGPAHRARASLGRRSRHLIAEGLTAAWIWGAVDTPPRPARYCLASGTRLSLPAGSGIALRQLVLAPADTVELDGCRTTTRLRTAVDLARFDERFGEVVRRAVVRLAEDGRFGIAECRELLDRGRNLHGKRRAEDRLRVALGAAQPALTRYTS